MTTETSTLATLLVSCPDRRGIVAALAQVLYGHGANILDSDQHTDTVAGLFFQRLRVDLAELMTDKVALERSVAELSERFQMQYRLLYQARPKRVALFVSKYDHCLYDLLLRQRAGELSGTIAAVISNHPDHEPLVRFSGVPFHHLPVTPLTKDAQEAAVVELLRGYDVELVVLARYMQILSPTVLDAFPSRIINIHHSFLPAFVGARPYHQAQQRGVKLIGATAHYVTADLDEGPIIEQDVARVDHGCSTDEMTAAGRDVECLVLARAVRWHVEHRVLMNGHKTVVFR